MNDFVIVPYFGLVNRIATIVSAIRVSKILGRTLKICWPMIDVDNCNVHFDDLFKKMPYEFVSIEEALKRQEFFYDTNEYKNIEPTVISSFPEESFYFKFCHWFFLNNIDYNFVSEMRYFSPVKGIKDKIDTYLKRYDFSKLIGVHVRKGDKCKSTEEKLEIDNRYIEEMKKYSNAKFFVASDENIDLYKDVFGNRIITREIVDRSRNVDGIKEAVVDFWLLGNTKKIIRGAGTFGMGASMIKGTPEYNVFSDKKFICFYK